MMPGPIAAILVAFGVCVYSALGGLEYLLYRKLFPDGTDECWAAIFWPILLPAHTVILIARWRRERRELQAQREPLPRAYLPKRCKR